MEQKNLNLYSDILLERLNIVEFVYRPQVKHILPFADPNEREEVIKFLMANERIKIEPPLDPKAWMETTIIRITNKGREFINTTTHNKEYAKERLNFELLITNVENAKWQAELNPLIKRANESTINTNRILIAIFALTLLVYALQLTVAIYDHVHKPNEIPKQSLQQPIPTRQQIMKEIHKQ